MSKTIYIDRCDNCGRKAPPGGTLFNYLFLWTSARWCQYMPKSRQMEVWCRLCWRQEYPHDHTIKDSAHRFVRRA